tara:strand:- start:797 stop:1018 length:222 start_codon:yes stop_codon:yes gene_type:complete
VTAAAKFKFMVLWTFRRVEDEDDRNSYLVLAVLKEGLAPEQTDFQQHLHGKRKKERVAGAVVLCFVVVIVSVL